MEALINSRKPLQVPGSSLACVDGSRSLQKLPSSYISPWGGSFEASCDTMLKARKSWRHIDVFSRNNENRPYCSLRERGGCNGTGPGAAYPLPVQARGRLSLVRSNGWCTLPSSEGLDQRHADGHPVTRGTLRGRSWLRDDSWCKWLTCADHYLGGGWLCKALESFKRAPAALKQRERVWGKGPFSYAWVLAKEGSLALRTREKFSANFKGVTPTKVETSFMEDKDRDLFLLDLSSFPSLQNQNPPSFPSLSISILLPNELDPSTPSFGNKG
ncbi:hypothetical protein CK203_081410 [Vitis vinifera]|uniref:Uncharacterized protein n=1 Tax=Vitis vinifera TaxID=29760 RepID=A0A438DG90_VITVI|nr:hypothetical protein CK203_081410 [Vitis vinifera]